MEQYKIDSLVYVPRQYENDRQSSKDTTDVNLKIDHRSKTFDPLNTTLTAEGKRCAWIKQWWTFFQIEEIKVKEIFRYFPLKDKRTQDIKPRRRKSKTSKIIYLDDIFIEAKYIRLIVIQLCRRTRQASFWHPSSEAFQSNKRAKRKKRRQRGKTNTTKMMERKKKTQKSRLDKQEF